MPATAARQRRLAKLEQRRAKSEEAKLLKERFAHAKMCVRMRVNVALGIVSQDEFDRWLIDHPAPDADRELTPGERSRAQELRVVIEKRLDETRERLQSAHSLGISLTGPQPKEYVNVHVTSPRNEAHSISTDASHQPRQAPAPTVYAYNGSPGRQPSGDNDSVDDAAARSARRKQLRSQRA